METGLIVSFWFIQALVIGVFGSKKKIGFGWTFVIALLIGPIAGIIAVLISKKKEDLHVQFPDLDQNKTAEKPLTKAMLRELVELEKMYKSDKIDEATYEEAKKRINERS